MFVLTFSPLGEKVNTIMVLIHQPVKKSTLGKIVKNCRRDLSIVMSFLGGWINTQAWQELWQITIFPAW